MSDLAISALASTDLDTPRRLRAAGAAIPNAQNQTPQTSNFPRKPTIPPDGTPACRMAPGWGVGAVVRMGWVLPELEAVEGAG
jgi:hypothetical protein